MSHASASFSGTGGFEVMRTRGTLGGAGQLDTRFDGEILAQRDDVECRVVEGTVEYQAAAVDRQPLAEREVGAIGRDDRPLPISRPSADVVTCTRPVSVVSSPAPANVRRLPRSTSTSSVRGRSAMLSPRAGGRGRPTTTTSGPSRPGGDCSHSMLPSTTLTCTAQIEPLLHDRERALAIHDESQVGAVGHAEVLGMPRDPRARLVRIRAPRGDRARRGEAAFAAGDGDLVDVDAAVGEMGAYAAVGERDAVGRRVDAKSVAGDRPGQDRLGERATAGKRDFTAPLTTAVVPSQGCSGASELSSASSVNSSGDVRAMRPAAAPATLASCSVPCARPARVDLKYEFRVERVVGDLPVELQCVEAEREIRRRRAAGLDAEHVAGFAAKRERAVHRRRRGDGPVPGQRQRRHERQPAGRRASPANRAGIPSNAPRVVMRPSSIASSPTFA